MHSQTLKEVRDYLQEEISEVESVILSSLKSEVTVINDVVNYLINFGGKKVRPMLVIAAAKLCNIHTNHDEIIYIASAIEMIHNATLLHDDVVDDSGIRRGVKNAKMLWGNKISILVGDLLFSVSFQLLAKCGSMKAISAVSDVAFLLSEGEVRQLTNSNTLISEQEYIKTISLKTASLFAISCSIPTVVSNDDNLSVLLYEFGINLGIAFQIVDDVLDYDVQASSGKDFGNDFYNSKVTLPVIICYNNATEEERSFWEHAFLASSDKDLEKALYLLNKHDALKKSLLNAANYVDKCLRLLDNFAESEIKHLLKRMLHFILNRDF